MVELKKLTIEELNQYNGKGGAPIYVCIKGKIFDVSTRPDLYGIGGSYALFAGREISRVRPFNYFLLSPS
jgi:membrane-associated progesterone receptor component